MKKCELCDSPAKMYCDSDRASLCWDCDARVHGANFLVAKHSRTLLCRVCQALTPWSGSGAKLSPTVSVCHNCVNGCYQNDTRNQGNDDDNDNDNDDREDDIEENEDEDDSNDDGDGDGGDEMDDEDEENQVVPWSTKPPPPVSRSSTSDESSNSNRIFSKQGRFSGVRHGIFLEKSLFEGEIFMRAGCNSRIKKLFVNRSANSEVGAAPKKRSSSLSST